MAADRIARLPVPLLESVGKALVVAWTAMAVRFTDRKTDGVRWQLSAREQTLVRRVLSSRSFQAPDFAINVAPAADLVTPTRAVLMWE